MPDIFTEIIPAITLRGLVCLFTAAVCIPTSANATLGDSDTDNIRNLLILSSVAATGLYTDKEGFLQFSKSLISTSVITLIAKNTVESERPNGQGNASFPSGHTSTAFAGAAFLQTRYGNKVGVPAYVMAASAAYSRVENKHHRWPDVIAGALLGWGVSRYFVTASGSSLEPLFTSNQYSLQYRYRY